MTDHMTDEAVQAMLNLLRSETEAASRTDAADMIEALHAELALARADAKAAVAVVVEKAAERIDLAEHDAEERDWRSGANAFAALAKAIRALAPEDAIAEVARIRQNAEATNGVWQANLRLIAERDRLAAELAAAIAREAGLRAERDMWTETARLHLNAEQAFLSWLREAGEHMRAEGVTVCDDGVDSGDILAAKVAECAALLKADRDTLAAELAAANAREAGLRQAVTKYHLALDSRENGNTAGYRLQDEVQRILDMPWRQGAALAQSSTEGGE